MLLRLEPAATAIVVATASVAVVTEVVTLANSASMSNNYLGESSTMLIEQLNTANRSSSILRSDLNNNNNNNSAYDDYLKTSTSVLSSMPFFHRSNLTYQPWLSLLILIIAVSMSLATIIGNVLVITAFIIEKSLRKYSNYFILNLSIADLLIGILIPPYAPFLLLKRNWRLGKTACTVWLVLDYVVGSASVLCIVVISLDRYLLVSRGLDYVAKQKVYRAILIMVTVWVIAFLNYAPAIIFWEVMFDVHTVKEGDCMVAFHDNLYYLTATACVEFFAPLISICGLNLAVYLNIKKRSKGLIRSENPQFTVNQETTTINSASNRTNQEKRTSENGATSVGGKKVSIEEPERVGIDKVHLAVLNSQSPNQEQQQRTATNRRPTNSTLERSSSTESSLSLDEAVMLEHKNKERQKQLAAAKQKKTTSFANINNNAKAIKSNKKKKISLEVKPTATTLGETRQRVMSTTYTKYNRSMSTSRTLTKDKKAARSLFILVFVFGFCWAPYTFLTLIKSVCPSCVNDEAHEFTFWLLWFNSTLNPIIYPLLHVKFRKAFARILHAVFFCFKFESSRNSQYREVSMFQPNAFSTLNRRHNNLDI